MREISLAQIKPQAEKKEDLSKAIQAAVKAALAGVQPPTINPSTVVKSPDVNVTVQKPAAKHVVEVKRDSAGRIERLIVSAYESE